MKIGFVGLGKLGFPVALTWASEGHDVVGYDLTGHPKRYLADKQYPHWEDHVNAMLGATTLRVADAIEDVVAHGDLIFIAVQTPHRPKYEGTTRLPEEREDFDYTALKAAVREVSETAQRLEHHVTMVVISTVLPGTSDREILPLLRDNSFVSYVYSPMFIAMGTVVEDARKPEFVLLGVDRSDARGVEMVREFFGKMHPEKLELMSVVDAEATKVAYNSSIGSKIIISNTWMEICHKLGADVDKVMGALQKATDRIVSPKYMRGGMGDGGGCHPRDLIALSWLAEELALSYDVFGELMQARESQTEWLAEIAVEEANARTPALPIVIMGKAYKKATNLTAGSPAILLHQILTEYDPPEGMLKHVDPLVDGSGWRPILEKPAVFVVATEHPQFFVEDFPAGSVVIDPWGKMPPAADVKVIRVGRR